MYYVTMFLGFLTPLPFLITFSSEPNQKLPFSDPSPLLRLRNTWTVPKGPDSKY